MAGPARNSLADGTGGRIGASDVIVGNESTLGKGSRDSLSANWQSALFNSTLTEISLVGRAAGLLDFLAKQFISSFIASTGLVVSLSSSGG